MKIEQRVYRNPTGWKTTLSSADPVQPDFVLIFGQRDLLEKGDALAKLRAIYPTGHFLSASTAGEIADTQVSEDGVVATAVKLEKTSCRVASVNRAAVATSVDLGRELANRLMSPDLAHVFVLSDGASVNGGDLARGFGEVLPKGVALTGGLAGDGPHFKRTVVGLDGAPESGLVAAIGFYGSALEIRTGSEGGWSCFGPERLVTRAEGNVLYELDGQSALDLYKQYLGEKASGLPAAALRFPLSVQLAPGSTPVVRTILSIDEATKGMVFAGDVPTKSLVRFMRASYEDLIDGAARAAELAGGEGAAELVLCVSCVGRRIVLDQRIEEETETIREAVGDDAAVTGFYSYGELAPSTTGGSCQLHNQTMTITVLRER